MDVVFEDGRFVNGREVAAAMSLASLGQWTVRREMPRDDDPFSPPSEDVEQRRLSAGTIAAMIMSQ